MEHTETGDKLLQQDSTNEIFPTIVIDGVFFQISQTTGIARVWRSLLREWSKKSFAKHIIVLDRDGTVPKFSGIRYRSIHRHDSIHHHDSTHLNGYGQVGLDAQVLQSICNEEAADLFISTYYTTPISTPSIFMGYDMIPEIFNMDLSAIAWREKRHTILHASHYITISASTARDLIKFFPYICHEKVTIAHCGRESLFSPASSDEVESFRVKFNISQPYALLVGNRLGCDGYKNSNLLFKALDIINQMQTIAVVCVGGESELERELQLLANRTITYTLHLNDAELKAAYSGAISLVYPSRYEGFGLPLLEAMACGCPVITCHNSSIPEVVGDAALYVDPDDPGELARALEIVQEPTARESLRKKGLEQAQNFSWPNMAGKVAESITQVAGDISQHELRQQDLVWLEFRKLQQEYQQACEESKQTQAELQQTQAELQQTQAELQQTQDTVIAMESSKFWKVRAIWFRLQELAGLRNF